MAYAYLARYYSLAGDCGKIWIRKEGIFNTFEEAEVFVSENAKEEIEEPPPETEKSATEGWWSPSTAEALAANARYEIIEFEIGSHNARETAREWLYDGAGRFVRLEDNGDETEQRWTPDPASYEGKYQLGDVVFVRAGQTHLNPQ